MSLKVRLTKDEITAIVGHVAKFDSKAEVFVYGSRANIEHRGGDIDLLIVSETITFSEKLDILSGIKEDIGDQKIDLTIMDHEQFGRDIFAKSTNCIRIP